MIIVNEDNFEREVLQQAGLVLVDFWSLGCGPCEVQAKILAKLEDRCKIAKIDVGQNFNIGSQYNISAVPTLIFFKNGQVLKKLVGLQNEQKLIDAIAAL